MEQNTCTVRFPSFLFRCYILNLTYRPKNYKELYNLRHAELHSVIKRTIGIYKKRFRIARETNFYPIETNVKLVPALAALHNFIRIYDPSDEMDITQEEVGQILSESRPVRALQDGISTEEVQRANTKRDQIAQEMWTQYREYNERHDGRRHQRRRRQFFTNSVSKTSMSRTS